MNCRTSTNTNAADKRTCYVGAKTMMFVNIETAKESYIVMRSAKAMLLRKPPS